MNNSFENQWRKVLQNAEENAPMDVWRKIEERLDHDLVSEIMFKNTLLEASESPDQSVWANIERVLDKERKPVFFIWFRKYAATGIAALLLLALSFSLLNDSFDLEPTRDEVSNISFGSDSQALKDSSDEDLEKSESTLFGNSEVALFQKLSIESAFKSLQSKNSILSTPANAISLTQVSENRKVDVDTDQLKKSGLSKMKLLLKKEFDKYGNRFTMRRNKLSYQTPDVLLAQNSPSFLQRSWFGLISGIAPFDPNFKINNFERDALVAASDVPRSSFEFNSIGESATNPIKGETFTIPLSQPYNDVKAGNSINLGFNYGKRIKRRFSLETGVRYVAGKSLVASNVYRYDERTGDVSTFLESYYIQQKKGVFDNTVISSGGHIDNDYKFLMVPIQVGYHFPLTQKLEASFATGISGDFIINNVFDNISEGGSKLTASNSAYKPLNISGIGALKINYMVHENWQVSIGSNVQQTLTSGVEKTERFSFRPKYLGINYGINYRFN